MRKSISQLRAINYAITARKALRAEKLINECREKGFDVQPSKYPEITIKRCNLLLSNNL